MAFPVRVAIDLTALQRRVTGCDRYFLELVGALAAIDAATEYVLFLNRGDRERLGTALPANFRTVALPFRGRAARLVFQQAVLPLWLRHLDVQVLHSPSFFTALAPTRARHVVTVHDLTFFSMPHAHSRLRRSRAFRAGVRASIRRADLVIVPSHATAAEVYRLAPGLAADAVRVVPLGVGPRFSPEPPHVVAAVLVRFGIAKPYLLHVGTLEPRKNLETLLEAFRSLCADGGFDLDLVLIGKTGWGNDGLRRVLQAPDLAGRVHRLGYVTDGDLAALYSGARVFVFPSVHEGFGLPPLEAMACGAPTVASSAGALVENLAGAAVLVEPSAAAIGAAVTRLLHDAAELTRLRAVGRERAGIFGWQLTAQATRACYEELARR
jgi:glycosyltransferase involved in cell wall biosynthesis